MKNAKIRDFLNCVIFQNVNNPYRILL